MSQAAPALGKFPTKSPQPAPGKGGQAKAAGSVFADGVGRTATRGDSDVLVLDHGITVYPARPPAPRPSRRSGPGTSNPGAPAPVRKTASAAHQERHAAEAGWIGPVSYTAGVPYLADRSWLVQLSPMAGR
jgi:hypothetical protein